MLYGYLSPILDNQLTTTMIESFPLWVLCKPKMKSMVTSSQRPFGVGRGVHNP